MSMGIEVKFTGQLNEPHREVAQKVIEAVTTALEGAELAYNPTVTVVERKTAHETVSFPEGNTISTHYNYTSSEVVFNTTVHKDAPEAAHVQGSPRQD